MNGSDVGRMPYGLAAIVLLVMVPIGFFWSSVTSTEGAIGLVGGIGFGSLLILAFSFVDRLMIRKGYRDERVREPVSKTQWAWFAVLVGIASAFAFYSKQTPFIGYVFALLVGAAADLWSRRKISA